MYDFPLLKAELEKVGAQLRSGILCVDSYVGIKEIFQHINNSTGVEDAKKEESEPSKTHPRSFSLINLHNHMLGCKPITSHGAEADCHALLRITAVLRKDWMDWVQENCRLFSDCEKMWKWG